MRAESADGVEVRNTNRKKWPGNIFAENPGRACGSPCNLKHTEINNQPNITHPKIIPFL